MGKLKILTAVTNDHFIEIQYYTFKRYLKCEYEFIVFNDTKSFPDFTNDGDLTLRDKVRDLCKHLGVRCIDIPNENHARMQCAVQRCADSMNVMLNYQIEYPDQYLVVDSDMFLVDEWDASRYMKYDCAIVLQMRNNIYYFWNGLFYFDTTRMKNIELLNWNPCPDCDVGGMMQNWLIEQTKKYKIPTVEQIRWNKGDYNTENTYFIHHLWSCTWDETETPLSILSNSKLIEYLKTDPRNQEGKFFCELYDNVFFHYRAGGNWRREGMEFHQFRTQLLREILV